MTDKTRPITVGELARDGRCIIAECQQCGHHAMLSAGQMQRFLPETPVTEAHKRMRCQCCGASQVLCVPQSDRDAKKGRAR